MKAVADANKARNLGAFVSCLKSYAAELEQGRVVKAYLADLYDSLLEQNLLLLRLVEGE